jgi:hypothetical protein
MLTIEKPVYRVSKGSLGFHHGTDRGRRLVCALVNGDLLEMRPHGARTSRAKTMSLFDIYDMAIRIEARAKALEKARATKEKKAIRLARQRQDRAERKLIEPLM